jgi:hypothetical protein
VITEFFDDDIGGYWRASDCWPSSFFSSQTFFRKPRGGASAHSRRGPTHRGEHRQVPQELLQKPRASIDPTSAMTSTSDFRITLEDFEMKISRRDATIDGLTLLAGSSMNTLAQAEQDRPLKRAIDDVEEREEVRRAASLTSKELANRTIYRRAVDAVTWGMPLVGEDTVKQAAFRNGKANYNDIVWWPRLCGKGVGISAVISETAGFRDHGAPICAESAP